MTESVEITKKHLGESSDAYKTSVKNLEMIQEKLQEHKIKSNHEILQETLKEMTTASCAQEYNLETAMASARKVLENSPKVVETGFVKGLDLCRAYFNEVCYPLLEREFANFLPRMAAGLIGEGSECYGFDDEISRDHDFGPSFQIYIPKEDMPVYGERLKHRLATLPKTFQGFGARVESQYGDGRVGVFTIEDFYRKFTAAEGVPDTLSHWRQIPENALSTVPSPA